MYVARDLSAPPGPVALATAELPYLVLAAGCLACVVWILLPDRWLLPTVVAGLLIGAGVVWGPGWSPQPQAGEGAELRVLTWNVQRLWAAPEGGGDAVTCVADVLRDAHP